MRQLPIPGFAALAALALLTACGGDPPPAPPPPQVGVVTLSTGSAPLQTELPGRISALETSEVRPQISGVVRRRLFEEGAMVRAGQLLYVIEDAPYSAALGTAQGNLARARASINATRLQAQRYRELVGINAVSRQEADNADAAAQQALADVTAQRAAARAAQINLDFTRIKAPISGRIGRSLVTPGALVQAGQPDPLATIQRTDRVYVDITQSAAQLLDLREAMRAGGVEASAGAPVRLILPNGKPYGLAGRLQFSEVSVDPASGAVTLRATFPNPDGLLLPGMFVRAQLTQGVRRAAILAPQRGITRDQRGRPVALVVGRGNKVEQRMVTVDRPLGDKWIVTGGLRPGDRLIVEGLMNLRPGTVVTPGAPQPAPGTAGN
ncbi:efflux RND transporter periplasmic adaptor subunit [Rhizorhabdus dicambivorans]|uniref:Efflux RND transporter periplasmic adaptor subunit n=1 Tax=Rhizorhabdus dicambivorans TaxID=1850238 RepID=A0A2A4FYT4_9SPHN|nr:efflux RND transporter periplasmic adaptor subunit [Rhizorhabdus dicambivorans]ATE63405.1 efflux RND transporter periplasmic adaptor subunit [Rhizorhabdus dicambivorans]PCE43622.1 efflux RND transporter periplasmic adaptor subunit [Rhizorhabdus dicambivorans]